MSRTPSDGYPSPLRRKGISLVELVAVIVVIALGAAFITMPYSTFYQAATTEDLIRRAAQLAQECADAALGKRRVPSGSYAGLVTGTYSADEANNPCRSSQLALDAGYTRTVDICDATLVTGTCPNAACTTGWSCKRIQVTVASGTYSTAVTYMVVNY